MKWKLLAPITAVILFVCCDKNSFETRPQIKVKALNGNVVPLGGSLIVTLEVTDKQGDLGNGQFIYLPELLNKRRLASSVPNYIPVTVSIPKFPDKSKSDLELRIERAFIYKEIQSRPGQDKNDTIRIKIVVVDRGAN